MLSGAVLCRGAPARIVHRKRQPVVRCSSAAGSSDSSRNLESTKLVEQSTRRPSGTAAMVAAARGAGAYLPPALQLIKDPYGFTLAGGGMLMSRWLAEHLSLIWSWLIRFPTPFGSRLSMVRWKVSRAVPHFFHAGRLLCEPGCWHHAVVCLCRLSPLVCECDPSLGEVLFTVC